MQPMFPAPALRTYVEAMQAAHPGISYKAAKLLLELHEDGGTFEPVSRALLLEQREVTETRAVLTHEEMIEELALFDELLAHPHFAEGA